MPHKQLTQTRRYHLYEMINIGMLHKDIPIVIGVAGSTINRELKRNRGKLGNYIKEEGLQMKYSFQANELRFLVEFKPPIFSHFFIELSSNPT